MSKSATFGITLEMYVTDAYVEIAGLESIVPPALIATTPVDSTSHDSTDGIKEFLPSGLKEWTDCTGSFKTDMEDTGQDAMRAAVGTIAKFKVTPTGRSSDPVIFNAIVISVENEDQPLEGSDMQSFTLKPTGSAPAS